MTALIRSSFHAFTLAMLACACMLVAQLVNALLDGALFPLPTMPSSPRQEAPSSPAASPTPLSEELLARRLGLSGAKQEQPVIEPPTATQSTQLALKLLGTMTATSPTLSLASIYEDATHRTRTVWTGSTLQGAEVIAIERTRVLLSNGDRVEFLEINPLSKVAEATPPLAPPAAAGPATGFGSTLRQTGAESYSIQRQDVENTLANLAQIATQARVVPAMKDGVTQGFKLFSMRPDSIYARLGMRNGDVLRRINGFTLDDPTRALEAYNHLRSASRIELEIERDGQPVRKTYTVEN